MRSIEPTLPPDLVKQIGTRDAAAGPPVHVGTYRGLVHRVAELAYLNKDHLLFYRGQHLDFRNKAGSSTFYPSIYRDDYSPAHEIKHLFDLLEEAGRQLSQRLRQASIAGHAELRQKRHIQWSVLQHYGVCQTPLLDLTHSLRVACSFAQLDNSEDFGFVCVFGLPYLTGRISVNSEHDIVNVRLLSICPPAAVRPYFQEGYLAGTEYVTTDYDSKTELDFKNRLVAKFRIPSGKKFWGEGFQAIPRPVLFPGGDAVEKACSELSLSVRQELLPGQLGEFVTEWSRLETMLLERARTREQRIFSAREAIKRLKQAGELDEDLARQLDRLRILRNDVVHRPEEVLPEAVRPATEQIRRVHGMLQRAISQARP